MYKTMLTVMGILCLCTGVFAQDDFVPVSRDYTFSANQTGYKALGINPANLSLQTREGQNVSFEFMNVEWKAKSLIVKNLFFHKQPVSYSDEVTVTRDNFQPRDLGREDLGLSANINWLGLSFRTKKAGSFAISGRTMFQFSVDISDKAKAVLYEDNNFDAYMDTLAGIAASQYASGTFDEKAFLEKLDGTKAKASLVHEINLGYSRHIIQLENHELYTGIGLRYLLGQMDFGLGFEDGIVSGYMTEIPFLPDSIDTDGVNFPGDGENELSGMGKGFGFDMGFTYIWKKKMQLSLALVDLGGIKWPVTPIYVKDISSLEEAQALVDEGVFYYAGESNSREPLPTKLIFGYNYGVHKWVNLYFDVVAPLNKSPKNLTSTLVAFGTELSLFKIASFRTGATLTNGMDKDGLLMPAYLSIFMGKGTTYEIAVGTQDLLAYFKPQRDVLGGSFGLLRFHF